MELSKRLQAVAGLISEGNRLVDVGTDHGYIPIYLVKNGKIPSAIAMDVKKGPLSRAEEHIEQAELSEYIECRLSDGLQKLGIGEGDSLLLAGMGGNLMVRILMEKPEVLKSFQEVVLQPQSAQALVRKKMDEAGWCVDREDIVLEEGKFYPMLRLIPIKRAEKYRDTGYQNKAEIAYGKLLLRQRHPVLKKYLDRQRNLLEKITAGLKRWPAEERSHQVQTRLWELEEEMVLLEEALGYYSKE